MQSRHRLSRAALSISCAFGDLLRIVRSKVNQPLVPLQNRLEWKSPSDVAEVAERPLVGESCAALQRGCRQVPVLDGASCELTPGLKTSARSRRYRHVWIPSPICTCKPRLTRCGKHLRFTSFLCCDLQRRVARASGGVTCPRNREFPGQPTIECGKATGGRQLSWHVHMHGFLTGSQTNSRACEQSCS